MRAMSRRLVSAAMVLGIVVTWGGRSEAGPVGIDIVPVGVDAFHNTNGLFDASEWTVSGTNGAPVRSTVTDIAFPLKGST